MKNNYLEALETAWRIANDGFPNGNEDIQKLRYGISLAREKKHQKKVSIIAKRDVDDFFRPAS